MRAVVLVGGFGTRLRPLTRTVPKNLVPVAGVPMIERVVTWLARHGVTEVVLSLGYRPDVFLATFPESRAAGVALRYVVEEEPLDTAGALRLAASEAGIDDTFVVANGDVLTDADLTSQVKQHQTSGAEGTIHLTPVDDPSRFGVVSTAADGRVTAFVEKPAPGTEPSNLINAGTYVLEPSVLDRIPPGRRVSVERETFPAMVADGTLYGSASDDYWIDAGLPETFLRATMDLLRGRRGEPPAPHAYRCGTGCWVLGSPTIEEGAGADASTLVCDGAIVGPGSAIHSSVVGPASRVGEGTSIDGSVLLAGAIVGAGAKIESSIVGPGTVIGEGARIAGLSVLGEGAVVAAGALLDGARIPAEESG